MAPSREIEKLQRRWQENPLGLTFAPLAEAYRKEGLYADALELLEIGLTQHPNYVPAHIVRGRCHLDTRTDAEAEGAFRRVLDLDPENVIALKGLAEVSERSSRFEDAAGHLERLLAFDRNNDDARAQLDRVRSMLVTPSPGTIDPEPVTIGDGRSAAPEPDEPAPEESETPAPPMKPFLVRIDAQAPTDTGVSIEEPEADAAPEAVTEDEGPAPVELASATAELDEAVGVEEPADGTADEPPADRQEPVRAEVVDGEARDLEVVLFHPVALTEGVVNEYQVPSDADDLHPRAGSDRDPMDDLELEDEGSPIEFDDQALRGSAEPPVPVAADATEPDRDDELAPEAPAMADAPEAVEEPAESPLGTRAEAPPEPEAVPEPAIEAEAEPAAVPEVEASLESTLEPLEAPPVERSAPDPTEEAASGVPEPVASLVEAAAPPSISAEAPPEPAPALQPAELDVGPEFEALADEDEPPEPEQLLTSDGSDTPADEPELVVTESMAEVFLRQGHRELALAVYSQLVQRDPDNERIREARQALEVELRPAAAGSALPAYAAALTGGQSVRSFFEQLLGAARPGEGPSLGAVFGGAAGTVAEAADSVEPGPSYDEFFQDRAEVGEIPRAQPTPPPQPAPGAGPEAEDIEEFNTWLRGLKR
jgi:tetratricopeptide (TPR) repeat protein